MSDIKPGNIAQNIGNILQAQRDGANETSTKDTVKETLEKAKETVQDNLEGRDGSKPVFKGFKHKSEAKSEITLPVTNIALRQSSIIYREEVNLAQTIIKEEDLFMDLLKLLWNHIIEAPASVTKSFESFLENVAEPDVEAMLYGFYLTSYGPEVKTDETLVCANCGGKKKVEGFNLINLYQETTFSGKPFEAIQREQMLVVDDGVTFYFRFPSLKKATSTKNVSKTNFLNEIASSAIANYTSRFSVVDGDTVKEYSDQDSIKNAVETLSVNARKQIKKYLQENFFKFGIKFEYKWKCENMIPDPEALNEKSKKVCGHENTHRYTINNLFFREISESVS